MAFSIIFLSAVALTFFIGTQIPGWCIWLWKSLSNSKLIKYLCEKMNYLHDMSLTLYYIYLEIYLEIFDFNFSLETMEAYLNSLKKPLEIEQALNDYGHLIKDDK